MDYKNKEDMLQDYCERKGFELASKIDDKLAVLIRKRSWWCPKWLYNKVIGHFVVLIDF